MTFNEILEEANFKILDERKNSIYSKNEDLNEGLKYFKKSRSIKRAIKRAIKRINTYPFQNSKDKTNIQKVIAGINNINQYIEKVEKLYKVKKITKTKAKKEIKNLVSNIKELQGFAKKSISKDFFKRSKLGILFGVLATGLVGLAIAFGDDLVIGDGEIAAATFDSGASSRDIASKFIAKAEGVRLKPYYDQNGFPHIGVGQLLSKEKWADLSQWDNITREQAMTQFDKHLTHYEGGVRKLFPSVTDPNEIAALTSFSFNVGLGAIERSDLRDLINDGASQNKIAKEWRSWNKASGKFLPGLLIRRNRELGLFYGTPI